MENLFADSCLVKNGGCDVNAECSHDCTTNEVKCTCKTGYVQNGSGTNVTCIDACTVKNGGCDVNAVCSHASTNNAVVCTCKTGYTNATSDAGVICIGKII